MISLLTLSLIFSSSVTWAETPTANENEIVFLNEELESLENEVPYEVRLAMENQIEALDCYQNIYNSFSKDEHGMPVYPEEYAGAYIEDGNLIIQLIDNSSEMQEKYLLLCNHSDKIIFREVEYSLNELAAYEEYATSMLKDGYDVIGFGIREKDNIFEITLNANSTPTSSINTYSLFGASKEAELPIKLLYQEQAVACASEIKGGDRIDNEEWSNCYMTVGICGTYNGKDALLTCGHGNEKVGIFFSRYPYISYNNERIGQVSYQRANIFEEADWIDTLGDFAIITLDCNYDGNESNNVTTTNRIYGGINISGIYSSLPEGTTIYKYGAETGLSYGIITRSGGTSINQYNYNSILHYVRGLYESEMQNASGTDAILPGDSGGPVYIKSGSNYLLHGIVTASDYLQSSHPVSTMYSTPIPYAIDVGFQVKTN